MNLVILSGTTSTAGLSGVAALTSSGSTLQASGVTTLPQNIDNYKTKIMRNMVRTPFDFSLSTLMGRLLHVVGTSDNIIGGQFGAADFLPNDPAGGF